MSWSGLANNQIVSDTNLADACNTGVFVPKTSIPSTGRMLTRNAALDYAFLTAMPSLDPNQLVQKSDLSKYVACVYGPYNQYVYATDGDRVYKSTNGGFSFAYYTALPYSPGVYVYTALAASSTGQYVIAGSNLTNTVYVSNDYGDSFSTVSLSGASPFTSFFIGDIDMSESGQYIAISGKNSSGESAGQVTVAVSSNYGVSFSVYTNNYLGGNGTRTSVAVSGDGSCMSYVAFNSSTGNSWRYYSTNYGSTFTSGGVSSSSLFTDIAMSNTGQYQMLVNYGTNPSAGGQIYVSNNYGSGFSVRSIIGIPSGTGYLKYCGMNSSGSVMYATGDGNPSAAEAVALSTDFGGSFVQTSIASYNPCYGAAVGNTLMLTSGKPYYCNLSTQYLNYYMPESDSYCSGQPLPQAYTLNKVFRKSYSY